MGPSCTRVIVVRVGDAEYAHIEAIARMRGMSMSDLAREALGLVPESDARDWPPPERNLRLVGDSRRSPRR
jgi:hypothetical protein